MAQCQAVTAQEPPRVATPRLKSGVAAKRSYPASEVRGGGQEELPCVRGRGGREELPHVRGQGWPGGDTLHPRSGVAARRGHPTSEVRGGIRGQGRRPRSGAAAERSYPTSEASGGWEETPRI